ncbi:MAG: hypothetical protein O7C59_10870 [Rickettsia endosymbiont of Ixodes persulcatus]|nr:hypothetical protein [Rickettsia endosymbiont of Ixodes persulcatus]MCZ6914882.1 hypothetical protein [Rickettsia endosymbiont of Ixodes persulcatus]
MIDPQDVDAISYKLNQLLTDNSLRDLLRHRGLIQADKFSWQNV